MEKLMNDECPTARAPEGGAKGWKRPTARAPDRGAIFRFTYVWSLLVFLAGLNFDLRPKPKSHQIRPRRLSGLGPQEGQIMDLQDVPTPCD